MMIMPRIHWEKLHKTLKSVEDTKAAARFEHTYSTVDELTDGIMGQYDTNKSGTLEVDRPWWAFWQSTENTRTTVVGSPWGTGGVRDVSIDRLTTLARQLGDGDGTITRDELRAAVDVYDTNYDGYLLDDELTRFKREVGER